ncbi:MAG: hypothetical protein QM754_14355 [Tepidisphaeraceae bacterium]
MSPLTKLFVVLLVLVSVALSAGTITFVNKLDPLQKELTALKTEVTAKTALIEKANADKAAAEQSAATAQQSNANETASIRTENINLRSTVADRDAQIAKLNGTIAQLTSAGTSQATALTASEASKTLLQDQVAGLRKDADERLRQNADLNQRVTTLSSQLEQTERARRAAVEQVTAANTKIQQQSGLIKDLGGSESQLAAAGTGAGAPAINGVIRSRTSIAGKNYATISLGSQDLVTKGMKFKILDTNGNFLGELTVEVVEANEAIGQINAEPQSIAKIAAGNVVRTQI